MKQVHASADETAALEANVEAVRRGDEQAYALIVRQCQGDIWRYLSHLVFDRETTKDLAQATFVQAYFNLQSYQPGTSFRAWLFTIARNMALNEKKKYARRVQRLTEYREEYMDTVEQVSGDSDDWETDRRQDALKACRQTLPEHLGQLVTLRYVENLAVEQMAAQLQRSVEAIRQSLWRIRNSLRECIEKRMAVLS